MNELTSTHVQPEDRSPYGWSRNRLSAESSTTYAASIRAMQAYPACPATRTLWNVRRSWRKGTTPPSALGDSMAP